jgi:hypothetical protein
MHRKNRLNAGCRQDCLPHKRHHEPGGCIGGVMVSAIDRRGSDEQRHYKQEAADPFVLGQRPLHTEGGGKCSGHMGTGENPRVDSAITQHP